MESASPYLHDLYAATRATVHLAVREGTSVACSVAVPVRRGDDVIAAHGITHALG